MLVCVTRQGYMSEQMYTRHLSDTACSGLTYEKGRLLTPPPPTLVTNLFALNGKQAGNFSWILASISGAENQQAAISMACSLK